MRETTGTVGISAGLTTLGQMTLPAAASATSDRIALVRLVACGARSPIALVAFVLAECAGLG
jgi:hypothetical protein